MPVSSPTPKIELHVHLEGAVRPAALLDIADRNGLDLPAQDVDALTELYRFRDFDHFIELWMMTTHVIRTGADFRQVVVSYAQEAAAHGAVYIEGIFTPAERVLGGASWDEVFTGFCDGADEARETTGVEVRLTPDIPRGFGVESALETARYSVKYRDRGVVALGLGGRETGFPPEPFAPAFRIAKDGGLGSVPHAGETEGIASIRGSLDALGADRLRHGIRAVDDPALLAEIAERGVVCDVCPISNIRTRAVDTIENHPLPAMLAAGVSCSISTDDPAMFDTDLTRDYDAAATLGLTARAAYEAGVRGALCDDRTRAALEDVGAAYAWPEPDRPA
ncbi:MAG: Adenosine deaminase [Actinomycetia bacterium]|jgi:aminodeoxyfutalosine deaminase|nr:Adenosine deaminase [Actinomycetes bacterium]